MSMLSIYVHFPFCIQKCKYCDFCSSYQNEEIIERYIHCLCKEIRYKAESNSVHTINTVYFGGGTPSIISPKLMEVVLNALHKGFTLSETCEFTSEANPGTLTSQWLGLMKDGGLNRLSVGAQAMQDNLLQLLGRKHSVYEIKKAADMAHRHGITNLSFDVMYGIPNQSKVHFLDSLAQIIALSPTHISAYSLILEKDTPLYHSVCTKELVLPSEDAVCDMEADGKQLLQQHGYDQYEISNYAKKGYECKHNIGYWQDKPYLGIGLSAHGMQPIRNDASNARLRIENTAHLNHYCTAIESDDFASIQASIKVDANEARFETMMLGLRMNCGVSNRHFKDLHGMSLLEAWGDVLTKLIENGLAKWIDDDNDMRFVLTKRGLDMHNIVALSFMDR